MARCGGRAIPTAWRRRWPESTLRTRASRIDRTGPPNPVPRVSGAIRRVGPIEAQDAEFLKARTGGRVKITIPGPFTMTQQAQNDYYPDDRALALDYADAVNAEARDLFAAGVDIVQLDEPYLQAKAEQARSYAIEPSIARSRA